jgi:hypothetical protein
LRNSVLAGCILVALGTLAPGTVQAACGEECDSAYSSDIDDCRLKYGDDPADADDLANCIQEARDDYRSCLDDCASAMISLPRSWRLAEGTLTASVRSLCRGPTRNGVALSWAISTLRLSGTWDGSLGVGRIR